jgi:hypothetical protein
MAFLSVYSQLLWISLDKNLEFNFLIDEPFKIILVVFSVFPNQIPEVGTISFFPLYQ